MVWQNYGHVTHLQFRIHSLDDSHEKFFRTNVNVYSTYPITWYNKPVRMWHGYRREAYPDYITDVWGTKRTVYDFQLTRVSSKGDPLILSMVKHLQTQLGWGGRGTKNAPKTFKIAFEFPDSQNTAFIIEKKIQYYHLMNNRLTKKNLMIALCRGIFRSCFEEDGIKLLDYLFKMIILPENVTYALENRTPYWYFDRESKQRKEVRLHTKLIEDDMCAVEISDGIWAPISINDLDIFINYFYHNHTRAQKWAYISPSGLWKELKGKEPSPSQKKLMLEFLVQNRTEHVVEERAEELLGSLPEKYPNRMKLLFWKDSRILVVRGKLCDWIIIDDEWKSNIQKVKTYVYISKYSYDEKEREESKISSGLSGPICIDNVHTNSSVGDQFAARALALLNDDITIKLVSTIARFIPKSVQNKEKESRFDDWENLENIKWEALIP